MKNLLITMAFLLTAIGVKAQGTNQQTLRAYNASFVAKATPDTTVNTDTSYLSTNDYTTSNPHSTYQVTLTNVTGTSTGTISCQGTDDGITWFPVTSSVIEVAAQTLTVSLTSAATQTVDFKFPTNQFARYRVRYISGGTQTSVLSGKLWRRKTATLAQTGI